MARNYILGGMAATQLQAGRPFFKRVVRIGADGTAGARLDELTCAINGNDDISFDVTGAAIDGGAKNWNAGAEGDQGELLMIEFPTTIRSVQILMEETVVSGTKEAAGEGIIRAKVMLTAPGQDVNAAEVPADPVLATPVANGNYIEIKQGETATINSRTKVVFILIQKFVNSNVFTGGTALTVGTPGLATDAASILITGVLDFEPTSGSSQADREPNSTVINPDTTTRSLRKIWGKGNGVG
mgnify:CR=1 FL=1|tara:strand:- start:84 stop:809 length:726 start_codon:yes stop_codon:yes gene_type:complete